MKTVEQKSLSEFDAALAYAHAWNRLNENEFIDFLATDAVYEAIGFQPNIEGKNNIHLALYGVFTKMRVHKYYQVAEVLKAEIKPEYKDSMPFFSQLLRDCVLTTHQPDDSTSRVLFFEIEGDLIKKVYDCDPRRYNFPGKNGIEARDFLGKWS